ncbi:uncharacterized protein [Rutidosis leptorrhynchoides]|uniref:uncharacterized protein n=1 Tax=Rutidosis leptorrhynchoides TaxID=125765 RepID=UPI003A9A1C71
MACSNNNINALNYSPLFNTLKNGTALPSPFEVNGHHYERGYYLGDGIYPDWAMLVKAPHNPTDEPRKKFKRFQECARKDIERAFGVLQENNSFVIGWREERMIQRNPLQRLEKNLRDQDARIKEIRDKQLHKQLEADLTKHIWDLSPYFRNA